MPVDPRLAHPLLLVLAAQRLKQRHQSQLDPYAVVWLAEYLDDPTEAGPSPSGIYLPAKYPTAEAWYHSPLVAGMRARLQGPGEGG
jgi:hypothetical protein